MRTAFSGRCSTRSLGLCLRVSAACSACTAALFLACSASDPYRPSLRVNEGDPEGPAFYEHSASNLSSGGSGSGGDDVFGGAVETPPLGPITIEAACVKAHAPAQLVKQAVDIIVLLDNSGSMEDEAAAVEANINVNFASMLTSSDVDYRVILLTRHRTRPRTPDDEEANTSVCVQVPLSNLASCDAATEPVFSPRFYQYSTKLESHDSLDIALDTYAPPFANSEREEKYDHAPLGWSEWLRPGAKKVFLEVTDDDELTPNDDDVTEDNVDMSATAFVSELQRMAPEQFGTDPAHPSFVFHSIVGLAEKEPVTAAYAPEEPVISEECTGNDGDVTSAGQTYQELSRITGGLRFPLCQYDGFNVVFQRIAEDVVLKRDVACDFDLPDTPRGVELNTANIAIAYNSGTQPTAQLGQAARLEDCQANAFYITDGRHLNLCPGACTLVRTDPLAAVDVLFTCRSQIIVH